MVNEKKLPGAPKKAPSVEIGPLDEFPQELVDNDRARKIYAYAAQSKWGSWTEVAYHNGVVSFNISYRPISNTEVYGAVNYYGSNGWTRKVFKDSISIQTGNAWANVHVCFYGNPFGTSVEVHGTMNS